MRRHLAFVFLCALMALLTGCPDATPDPNLTSSASSGSGMPAAMDETYSAGPFAVDAAGEIVMCTFVKGTNTEPMDVTGFETKQSVGGHHLIVYTIDHPVDSQPVPCSQGGEPGWVRLLATQLPTETQAFPNGVGFHVDAHQQYVMEAHYINASDAPIMASSSFVEHYARAGEVTTRAGSFAFGTVNIDIPPNGTATANGSCAPPAPMTIHTIFGHEHRYGTGVDVAVLPGGDAANAIPVYSTTDWENPAIKTIDNGLTLDTSDKLSVSCTWNNTGSERLGYPHEMCFAVGYYWPADATYVCVSTGGSDECACVKEGGGSGPGGSSVEITLSRADTIPNLVGDAAAGLPIYCDLFRASDWTPTGPVSGALPPYLRDAVDAAPLTDATSQVVLTIQDVTPGDYVVACNMDTIYGGFGIGPGDPINSMTPMVTVVAGQIAKTNVVLDVALP